MKKLILLFVFSVGLCISSTFAATQPALISVASDGNRTEYVLESVQKIVFDTNEDNSSMTIKLKNGEEESDVKTVLFGFITELPAEMGDNLSMYVYPSPVSSVLTVKGIAKNAELHICDLNGKVLQTKNANGEESVQFNVSSLVDGVYLLQVGKQVLKFTVDK